MGSGEVKGEGGIALGPQGTSWKITLTASLSNHSLNAHALSLQSTQHLINMHY